MTNRKQKISHATVAASCALLCALFLATGCASGTAGDSAVTPAPALPAPPPAPAPAPAAQAPDRGAPPAVGEVPQLRLPAIQRFTLSNGMRVVLMEKHDLPLAQVNLVIDAGSVNDPADHVGLASLTADMLDEGAAGRKALDIASAFELLGARFNLSAGSQNATAALHVPAAELPSALRLAADIVTRPDFPTAELDRLRRERTTSLVRMHDSPGAVAMALLSKTLFTPAHPYGRATSAASLAAITTSDVKRFYETYWTPNNTTAVVVGDITADVAKALLESALGSWKAGAAASTAVPAPPQVQGRRIFIVDKPGAAQSVMVLGRIGAARSSADYFPLEVMNTILGGSFTSRLNQNLREKHGYAYGASSNFDFRLAPGSFTAQSNVQTQSTGAALAEFMTELRRIREDVTAEEVQRAKNNMAMSYPPGFQSVAGIAGRISEIIVYDLPADYFNQFTSRVLAVTRDDVLRVAKQYVDPDNITIFIVGDRAKIEQQVRQQNLGNVTLMTVVDVLGPVPVVR